MLACMSSMHGLCDNKTDSTWLTSWLLWCWPSMTLTQQFGDHLEQLCCDQGRFLDMPVDDGTILGLLTQIARSDVWFFHLPNDTRWMSGSFWSVRKHWSEAVCRILTLIKCRLCFLPFFNKGQRSASVFFCRSNYQAWLYVIFWLHGVEFWSYFL